MRDGGDEFRLRGADDPASLLVVILDTSIRSWAQATGRPPAESVAEASAAIQSTAEQVLVFLNTFLLLHEANRVAFITSGGKEASMVYPIFPDANNLPPNYDASAEDCALDGTTGHTGPNITILDPEKMINDLQESVIEGVLQSLREQEDADNGNRKSPITSALGMGLCLLNRVRRIKARKGSAAAALVDTKSDLSGSDTTPSVGRVLVMLAGSDSSDQYVSLMNCMFSAQRYSIPIDSCILAKEDSTYFQQASHLTKGVYLKPEGFSTTNPDTLIEFLQTVFLVDKHSRDFLAMPTPDKVDFRASCLVTKKIIDDGYTCSVCLSTFDVSVGKTAPPMCPICDARFAVQPRRRKRNLKS